MQGSGGGVQEQRARPLYLRRTRAEDELPAQFPTSPRMKARSWVLKVPRKPDSEQEGSRTAGAHLEGGVTPSRALVPVRKCRPLV